MGLYLTFHKELKRVAVFSGWGGNQFWTPSSQVLEHFHSSGICGRGVHSVLLLGMLFRLCFGLKAPTRDRCFEIRKSSIHLQYQHCPYGVHVWGLNIKHLFSWVIHWMVLFPFASRQQIGNKWGSLRWWNNCLVRRWSATSTTCGEQNECYLHQSLCQEEPNECYLRQSLCQEGHVKGQALDLGWISTGQLA